MLDIIEESWLEDELSKFHKNTGCLLQTCSKYVKLVPSIRNMYKLFLVYKSRAIYSNVAGEASLNYD